MSPVYNKRWYDKYTDLSNNLERLKESNKRKREKIFMDMKNIIMEYDSELIDRHVLEFPLTHKQRWYDKDPFSWLVINTLEYADDALLSKIRRYLKGRF